MADVIDIRIAKLKKAMRDNTANNRQPLYLSYLGKTGANSSDNFDERFVRVKESLNKINELMFELRKLANNTKVIDKDTDK